MTVSSVTPSALNKYYSVRLDFFIGETILEGDSSPYSSSPSETRENCFFFATISLRSYFAFTAILKSVYLNPLKLTPV